MAEVFLRKYRLIIGGTNEPGKEGNKKDAAVITDLHIDFEINQTSDKKANSLELKIYNLADKTIALFEQKDAFVSLEVGYGDDPLGLIFRGTKTHMTTRREGTHRITEVFAAEGYEYFREGRVGRTHPKGVTLRKVISDLISDGFEKLSKNLRGDILDKKVFNSGYSVVGSAHQAMDSLCKAHGLEWNILNNTIVNVFPIKGTQSTLAEAVLLTPNTGLINTPEKISQEVKQLKKDLKLPKDPGVKIKSVMNYRLIAGTYLKLQDTAATNSTNRSLDGVYKIEEVTHRGSFEGDEWITEVRAVEI